jgi:hypothetical protein
MKVNNLYLINLNSWNNFMKPKIIETQKESNQGYDYKW